jgi:hypothetical protein
MTTSILASAIAIFNHIISHDNRPKISTKTSIVMTLSGLDKTLFDIRLMSRDNSSCWQNGIRRSIDKVGVNISLAQSDFDDTTRSTWRLVRAARDVYFARKSSIPFQLAHFKTLNTLRKQRISQQHSNKKFST